MDTFTCRGLCGAKFGANSNIDEAEPAPLGLENGFTVCKGCSQRPVHLHDDQTHSYDLFENFCSKASYFITTVTHLTWIPQLKLQSTFLTDSDMSPFHRPFSGQKGISKVKRNERMGKTPNQNRILSKNPYHRHPPHTPLTAVPFPPTSYSPCQDLPFSLTQDTREEGEIPPTSTLHRRAYSLLNLQLLFHRHSPQRWLKKSPSLTQPRPNLASRSPRNLHADAHRCLAFPWSAFLRQTSSSLC